MVKIFSLAPPRLKRKTPVKSSVLDGGDGGTRTPDPLHAKQVLYQLSYIPTPFDSAQGDTGDLEDCTCRDGHLSKQMSKLLQVALIAAVFALPVAGVNGELPRPVAAAQSRCNSQTIDGESARIRDYDRHPPAGRPSALLARYGAIADVIATLTEEHGILNSVCLSDAQKAPLFEQIAATSAWAIALESDVAARLNASCPAAAKALPTIMLADAWLALARVINDGGGTVPASFAEVIPKIQTRAQVVGLTLPAWPETSQYWRDQLDTKEKAEIATCPSPSPTASP